MYDKEGATFTELSARAAREAAVSGKPVEYRTEDHRGIYRGERIAYYASTRCSLIHERLWENERLIKDRVKEVCEGIEVGRGYLLEHPPRPPEFREPQEFPQPPIKLLQKADINEFTFGLTECVMFGQNISCNFFVVNNSDRMANLKIYGRARQGGPPSCLYDDLGNEYKAHEVEISGVRDRVEVERSLAPGIPTIVSFRFGNVSTSASEATLNIHVNLGGYLFRNIPLTKRYLIQAQ